MPVQCPECYSEDAYFDGVQYVCPDCGNELSSDFNPEEEDEDF